MSHFIGELIAYAFWGAVIALGILGVVEYIRNRR